MKFFRKVALILLLVLLLNIFGLRIPIFFQNVNNVEAAKPGYCEDGLPQVAENVPSGTFDPNAALQYACAKDRFQKYGTLTCDNGKKAPLYLTKEEWSQSGVTPNSWNAVPKIKEFRCPDADAYENITSGDSSTSKNSVACKVLPAALCSSGDIGGLLNFIINFLTGLIGLIAVAVIVFSGIRITTSAGNPDAIAGAKKMLFGAVLGLILLVSMRLILGFLGIS